MLKLFKKRSIIKEDIEEKPLRQKVAQIISRIFTCDSEIQPLDFNDFKIELNKIDRGQFFSIAEGSDNFSLTLFICGKPQYSKEIVNELSNLIRHEVLQYEYQQENYLESLWSLSSCDFFSYKSDKINYYICINNNSISNDSADTILISNSCEFILGTLLLTYPQKPNNPFISVLYKSIKFSGGEYIEKQQIGYRSLISIGEDNYTFYYILSKPEKGDWATFTKTSSSIIKMLIKEQIRNLGYTLKKKISILKAGPINNNLIIEQSNIRLNADLISGTGRVPIQLIFPKKILSLFPDFTCRTVKGKILLINKYIFRKNFSSYYKTGKDLLFVEFLNLIENRDLSLVCQNYFLSNSFNAAHIRKLFYFKITSGKKTIIKNVPLLNRNQFLNHLPLRFRENFLLDKSYCDSYGELVVINITALEGIYRNMEENKLLLSYKARYILEKEYGSKEKEKKSV